MDIDIVGILVGAGLIAGFLSGLLGIGGGIVTVPVMFLIFERLGIDEAIRMQSAIGTSLLIIVATVGSSARAHAQRENVDVGLLGQWWWLIALGSIIGAQAAQALRSDVLVLIFCGLATVLGVKMLIPTDKVTLGERLPTGVRGWPGPFLIGLISAVMGIGGGAVSVPYMTLFGVPVHRAVGTAAAIGFVASIVGMLGFLIGAPPVASDAAHYMLGYIHLPTAAIIGLASVLIAPLGAAIAQRLPKSVLSIGFGVFILLAVARMMTKVL